MSLLQVQAEGEEEDGMSGAICNMLEGIWTERKKCRRCGRIAVRIVYAYYDMVREECQACLQEYGSD